MEVDQTDLIVDKTTKIPAQLSRFFGQVRPNTKAKQVTKPKKRINNKDFFEFLNDCDDVRVYFPQKNNNNSNNATPEMSTFNLPDFLLQSNRTIHNGLKKLEYEGSSAGTYPMVRSILVNVKKHFKCDQEFLIQVRDQVIVPMLEECGWDTNKILKNTIIDWVMEKIDVS